jgi:hypothetical protein
MRLDPRLFAKALRHAAPLAAGVLGIVALVGSGGGVSGGECSFFSNTCNPVFGPIDFPLFADVTPAYQTVQVGTTVKFTAQYAQGGQLWTFQWQRSTNNGQSWSDITGATTSSYTLPSATLVDDANLIRVILRDSANAGASPVTSSTAKLAVSAQSGVVLQDTEFQPADWQASATASPATNGPTHSEERVTQGGASGAWRRMLHTMPAGPSELTVVHLATSQAYDPSVQGAIYVIDAEEACIEAGNTTSTYQVSSQLLLEQAGRRYVFGLRRCSPGVWYTSVISSLLARDFALFDGPACPAAQTCPDFSATAPPLRFGYVRRSQATAGVGGTITHGVDNWKVTVWRR